MLFRCFCRLNAFLLFMTIHTRHQSFFLLSLARPKFGLLFQVRRTTVKGRNLRLARIDYGSVTWMTIIMYFSYPNLLSSLVTSYEKCTTKTIMQNGKLVKQGKKIVALCGNANPYDTLIHTVNFVTRHIARQTRPQSVKTDY